MDPPAGACALTLVVEKGPRKGRTVECRPGGRVRIGRVVKGNTFTIKEAGISQAHLSIEAGPGGAGWALTDLGSSNGTFLNGVWIEPSAPADLRDGDAIKIGEETAICVRIAEVEVAAAAPAAAGRRRNPRRGCAAVAEEAGGAARGRGRPRRTATAGGDGAGDEERADLNEEDGVKERKKKTASRKERGRGRGASRKAPAAPSSLDLVSEESEKEEPEAVVNSDCRILKEVKQELSDSVQILSVKGPETAVRTRRGALRRATTTAGAPEEPQARVEDEMDAPLRREEEDVPGANPGVEEGRVDMENMTLEEWFDRMEKYLPKVINGIAEEIISEIKAKAERFNEYVGNSVDPEQRDRGGAFIGLM